MIDNKTYQDLLEKISLLEREIDELKKSNEKSKENEQKFSLLFESLPIAVNLAKFENGEIVNVNKEWLKLTGFDDINSVVGKTSVQLGLVFEPEKRNLIIKEIQENGFANNIEFNFKSKNGVEKIVLGFFNKILINNQNYILSINKDITERVFQQNEILKAKKQFEENEKELKIKNEEYEGINEELRQTNEELYKAKINAEENEKKFRVIAENINMTFVAMDNNIKVIYWNKKAEEVSGIKSENAINKTFTEIFGENENTLKATKNYIESINTQKQINYTNEYVFNGTRHYFDVFIIPNKKGIVALSLDITERKNNENEILKSKRQLERNEKELKIKNEEYESINEELRQTNEELYKVIEKVEESDRLKTAFLQNMSHEIRTPLNAISGFSGLLNNTDLSVEKRKSFVSIIQNSSNQLVSIITDILTISSLETKQEKQNIEKVCINNIIVDLLTIFKQQAQNQNISLYASQQINDKNSEIYTDKIKLTQILTNLLTNSLKFTHEGFIEFGYRLKNNELEFYVKDSGIGIKPEFQEKIFERFRQADKSINKLYGGTGLGLAISKAFVELLGGKIWVKSELEKGSTFYFTIPYKPVNAINITTTSILQNENFRTVLVAEDEEYNFLFIEELLIGLDLKLIHAKDGQETVDIFKTKSNIDLILMDIKMPIMTGFEAARIIKGIKPDLPIVAQSAYALEHERASYEGIFDDYLTKPINENDLKQMIMKYIDIQNE